MVTSGSGRFRVGRVHDDDRADPFGTERHPSGHIPGLRPRGVDRVGERPGRLRTAETGAAMTDHSEGGYVDGQPGLGEQGPELFVPAVGGATANPGTANVSADTND